MTDIETQQKILDLDTLAQRLRATPGKRVVHCHGVFDLLHVGHIRHLERARQLGDLLVVTVTPDRFVNKGPNRPVFTERLRAGAIASLACVDYVAVNRWPTSVETIRLLRPQVYVKGSEYRDAKADRTGGIAKEREAIESVGGRLAFTDEITFSSSKIINEHLPTVGQEAANFLANFRKRQNAAGVLEYLDHAKDLKVLVVGEAIIDEYQFCEAIGKSSKEPMLALKHLRTERFAGGTLAVANNMAAFAGEVGVLAMVGDRETQEEFIRASLRPGVAPRFLARTDAPTIVKRRFVEHYHLTKLLEIYEFNDSFLGEEDDRRLCAALEEALPEYDAVVVVDYGHGMLTKAAIDLLCRKAPYLAVNAQSNAGNLGYHTISKYPRADFISLAEKEMRLEARDRHGELREMVLDLAERVPCGRIVVTQGKHGCLLWGESEGFREVPALTDHVVDRMGAGDAFLSVATLCAVQKAPLEIMGFVGNAAGAEAVASIGHRNPLSAASLGKHIEHLLK